MKNKIKVIKEKTKPVVIKTESKIDTTPEKMEELGYRIGIGPFI
jgi:hypothetical protein